MPKLKVTRIALTPFRKELRWNVDHVEHTNEALAIIRNGRTIAYVVSVKTYKILEDMDDGTISGDF